MSVPGSNIRTLRNQLGISLRDLAKETGIEKGNLSKLEAGKVGYSRDVMERIAKVLKVSLGVLFADPGVVEAAALHMRQAPLLTADQLKTWTGPDEFEAEDEQVFLYVALNRASRFVFALKANDGFNAPTILPGDELIFDAKGKPTSGVFVAAQDSAGAVHVGMLRPIGSAAEGEFEVIPAADFTRSVSSKTAKGLRLRGTLAEIRRPA